LQYRCELCETGGFTDVALKHHFEDEHHQTQVRALTWDVNYAMDIAGRVCRLLSAPVFADLDTLQRQIRHADSLNAVNTEFFHYLMNSPAATAQEEEERFERPIKKMRLCLATERLILVGLAVWKAQCVWHMPPVTDYAAAQEWMRHGWKNVKVAQRDSNAMSIVLSAVRPFLYE
jgi:hypothetical protein